MATIDTLTTLKQQHAETQQLRARAEASLEVVQRQEQEARAELERLGVNPETAEQELQALNEGLDTAVKEYGEALAVERAKLTEILNAAKAAGVA